ncbi:hypothetical protein Taro_029570, partial [Colocasia esculenta]|nr:hypothetical protein [Colocasia esculenta]
RELRQGQIGREQAKEEARGRDRQTQQQQRYVVDVEFAGEFVVARPTAEYVRVSAELPRVYVGKPEELRRLLRLLAEAAKRSLRAREMHLPPWRKGRYMQAKWLGAYRRTLNPVPSGPATVLAAASPPPSFAPGCDMKCRFVGFDTAAAKRVIPPAARTR